MNSKEEIRINSSVILLGNSEYRVNKPIRLSSHFVTVPFEDDSRVLMLSLSFTNITKIEFLDMDQNSGVAFVFHLNEFMMKKVRGSLNAVGMQPKKRVPELRQINSRLSIISSADQEERVLMLDFPDSQPERMGRLRAILLEAEKSHRQSGLYPNFTALIPSSPSHPFIVKLISEKWVIVLERFGKRWTMEDRIANNGMGGTRIVYRVGRTYEPGMTNPRITTDQSSAATSSQSSADNHRSPVFVHSYPAESNSYANSPRTAAYEASTSGGLSSTNNSPGNVAFLAAKPTKEIKTEPSVADSEDKMTKNDFEGNEGNAVKMEMEEEEKEEEKEEEMKMKVAGRKKRKRRIGDRLNGHEDDEDWEPSPPPPPTRKKLSRRHFFKLELLRSELARLANEFGLKLVERNQRGNYALMPTDYESSHNFITLSDNAGKSAEVEVGEYRNCELESIDQWEKGSAKQFVLTVQGKCLEFFQPKSQ